MKISKEIREWVILVVVFGGLYFSGAYKEVAGFLQSAVLELGIIKPELIATEDQQNGSYDFYLEDASGNTVDFKSFQGKTVFMNYWATWCPPCIAEMPDINDLYNKVNAQGVAFVMISVDDDFSKAISFMERKEYDFPIYKLSSRRPDVYSSKSIPTTFVLSPSGKIIAKRAGMAKYDTPDFIKLLTEAK